MAEKPQLIKPIPAQIMNEGAAYGPLYLTEYIANTAYIRAEINDGRPIPTGLICTSQGMINGIAASGTEGVYKIKVTAENDIGESLIVEFDMTIKQRISVDAAQLVGKMKAQVWEALGKNLPLPDLGEVLERPITPLEIYHLLLRFSTLTIWDAYNLDYPGEKVLLNLKDTNPHYNIYDRGSCLVAAPKDLFSFKRTRTDALQASQIMAAEAYKRGWGAIELVSFDRMMEVSAWLKVKQLGDESGKQLEVLRFSPSAEEMRVYTLQAQMRQSGP